MIGVPNLSDRTTLNPWVEQADVELTRELGARASMRALLKGRTADLPVAAPRTGAEVLLTNHPGRPPAGWETPGVVQALRATRPDTLLLYDVGTGPPCGRIASSRATSAADPVLETDTAGYGVSAAGQPFTAAVWLRFPDALTRTWNIALSTRAAGDAQGGWDLRFRAGTSVGNTRFDLFGPGPPNTRQNTGAGALTLSAGTWHLLGGTFTAPASTIWVDGVQRGETPAGSSSAYARIVARGFDSPRVRAGLFAAGGFVAAAAFWRRALSQAEWTALYAPLAAGGLGALDLRAFVSLSGATQYWTLDEGGQPPAVGSADRPAGNSLRAAGVTPAGVRDSLLDRAASAGYAVALFVRIDALHEVDATLDVRLPEDDASVPADASAPFGSPVRFRQRGVSWGTVSGQPNLPLSGWTIGGRPAGAVRLYSGGVRLTFTGALPAAADYADFDLIFLRPNAAGDAAASSTQTFRLSAAARSGSFLSWTADTVALRADIAASLTGWSALLVDRTFDDYDAANAVWKPRLTQFDVLRHGDTVNGPAQALIYDTGGATGTPHVQNLATGSPRVSLDGPVRLAFTGTAAVLDNFYPGPEPGMNLYAGPPGQVQIEYLGANGTHPVKSVWARSDGVLGLEMDDRLPSADEGSIGMVLTAGGQVFAAAVLTLESAAAADPDYSGPFTQGSYSALRTALLRDPRFTVRIVRTDTAGVNTGDWTWNQGPASTRPSLRWWFRGAPQGAVPGSVVEVRQTLHDDGAWHLTAMAAGPAGIRTWLDGAPSGSDAGAVTGGTLYGTAWSGDAAFAGEGAVLLDEIVQWNRVPSDAEMADLWSLRGVERLFGGYLDGPARSWPKRDVWSEISLSAVAYGRDLDDRRIEGRLTIPPGTTVETAVGMILGFSGVAGGRTVTLTGGSAATTPRLAVSATRISAAVAAAVVGPQVFDYLQASQALDWVRDQARCIWHVDQYGALVMRQARAVRAVAELRGDEDVMDGVSVESNEDELRTRQIVIGGPSAQREVLEVFDGSSPSQPLDGTRRTWLVGERLTEVLSIQTRRPLSANPVVEGGEGYSGADRWVIDRGAGTITQAAGETTLTAADQLAISYVSDVPIIVSMTSDTLRDYGRVITDVEQDAGILTTAAAEVRCRSVLDANDHVTQEASVPLVLGRFAFLLEGEGVRIGGVGDVDERITWLIRNVRTRIVSDTRRATTFQSVLGCIADDTEYDPARPLTPNYTGRVPETEVQRARRLARITHPSVPPGREAVTLGVFDAARLPVNMGGDPTLRAVLKDGAWRDMPSSTRPRIDASTLSTTSVTLVALAAHVTHGGLTAQIRLRNITRGTYSAPLTITNTAPAFASVLVTPPGVVRATDFDSYVIQYRLTIGAGQSPDFYDGLKAWGLELRPANRFGG